LEILIRNGKIQSYNFVWREAPNVNIFRLKLSAKRQTMPFSRNY
jgi:hypothetical protein